MVNKENYEEYMVLYADGELNQQEETALLAYVKEHPQLQEDLDLYAATKMIPDETIVFADKKSLMKPKGGGRTIFFGGWQTYAAAASVAILLAVFFFNRKGDDIHNPTQDIAQHNLPKTHHPENNNANNTNDTQNTTLPTTTTQKNAIASNKTTKQHQPTTTTQKSDTKTTTPIENKTQATDRYQPTVVAIETSTQRYLPSDNKPQLADLVVTNAPVQPLSPEPKTITNSNNNNNTQPKALDYIPILNDNKALINGIEESVAKKIDKVKKVSDDLKNSDVVLKLGKKQILLVKL